MEDAKLSESPNCNIGSNCQNIWQHKDLIDTNSLSLNEIELIMQLTARFREHNKQADKKLDILRGRTVTLFFSEASTRTKTSFDTAGKRLGADTFSLGTSGSSVQKGESLKDTAQTLESLSPDLIVIRDSSSGAADYLARHLKCSVVNAGDGQNAHPTQALLDLFTLKNIWQDASQSLNCFQGKTVLILGDITHSRVARSNLRLLTRLGVKVRLCAPKTLLPKDLDAWQVEVFSQVDKAVQGVDAIIALRLQLERQQAGLLPDLAEYAKRFCLTSDLLALAKPEVKILHPGPLNRGLEISSDLADSKHSVVLEQVASGLAVRMAVLTLYITKHNPFIS